MSLLDASVHPIGFACPPLSSLSVSITVGITVLYTYMRIGGAQPDSVGLATTMPLLCRRHVLAGSARKQRVRTQPPPELEPLPELLDRPERWPSRTRCLTMAHRCSTGFRSGDWAGQARVATWFASSHSCARRLVCFGSLSCCKIKVGAFVRQEPRRRGQHVPFQDLGVYGTRHSDEVAAQVSDPNCRHDL